MPSISGDQTLRVTAGVTATLTLTGSDADVGDTVTLHQVGNGQPGVTLNEQTGQVQYTPNLNTPVNLRLVCHAPPTPPHPTPHLLPPPPPWHVEFFTQFEICINDQ